MYMGCSALAPSKVYVTNFLKHPLPRSGLRIILLAPRLPGPESGPVSRSDTASRRIAQKKKKKPSARYGTNPSRTKSRSVGGGAYLEPWAHVCMLVCWYVVFLPRAETRRATNQAYPSPAFVRALHGGQSNWQVGIWAMSSPFPSALTHSLSPRRPLDLHTLLQFLGLSDWSIRHLVPFATSRCSSVVHLPSRDMAC